MARKELSISERFTLPESRTACREGDVLVSTKEYRRLRALEGAGDDLVAEVDPTQIRGLVAEDCEAVTVERTDDLDEKCYGPKAVKASGLSKVEQREGCGVGEYDDYRVEGLCARVEKIGRVIIDKVISHFKDTYSVDAFLHGDLPDETMEDEISEMGPKILVGFGENGSTDHAENIDRLAPGTGDMFYRPGYLRDLFLCNLHHFVESEVNEEMRRLLTVSFNGESIWDRRTIKVKLMESSTRVNGVDVEVFFRELPEEEIGLLKGAK